VVSFGQVGEFLIGYTNFLDIRLTCIGNLVTFLTFILRFKYWYDYMYRGMEASLICNKWKDINQLKVLTMRKGEVHEYCVIMLSFHKPISITFMKQFMRHISNLYYLQSLSLQCFPLQSVVEVAIVMCRDTYTKNGKGRCRCIVFNTLEYITMVLALRMSGTLEKLYDSQSLLPSLCFLRNVYHRCNQRLLYVENG